ncbi:MAG: hypothetical protein EBT63_07140, partial [Proteobacteria bacterium]|nr:hypothetical protein [Pseudomonadota bacterium]
MDVNSQTPYSPKTRVSNPVIKAANEAAAKARSVAKSLNTTTGTNDGQNPTNENFLNSASTLLSRTGDGITNLGAGMSDIFNNLDVKTTSNKPQEGNPGQNSRTDLSKPVEISTSSPAGPVEISSIPPTNTPVGPKGAENKTKISPEVKAHVKTYRDRGVFRGLSEKEKLEIWQYLLEGRNEPPKVVAEIEDTNAAAPLTTTGQGLSGPY